MSAVKQPDDRIRVLVVDDQPLFRRAIATLLSEQDDFEVVSEAGTGLEALEKAHHHRPDIVLMDQEMPVMDGIASARLMRDQLPEVKIVMLTVDDDDEHLFAAIQAGVSGYLLKDLRPEQLYDMLRSAVRNETPMSPALVSRVLAAVRDGGQLAVPQAPRDHGLSQRELEVLRLVADGLSNKEIGVRLSITEGTVKNHVHNALAKLEMDNRIQAAAYIVRQGLGARQTRG